MRVGNLRIGTRLGMAFAVLLLLMAGVGGFGVASMARIQNDLERLVTRNDAQVAYATTMSARFRDILMAIAVMVQAQDKAVFQEQKAKMGTAREQYGAAKKAFIANISDPRETEFIERLDAALKTVIPLSNKVVELAEQGNLSAASEGMLKQSEPAGRVPIGIVDELVKWEQGSAVAHAARSRSNYLLARNLVFAACAVTMLLGALVAWLSTLSITRPLQKAVKVAETVATGDLTVHVEGVTRDETGRLLQALRMMRDSLARVAGDVRAGSYGMSDSIGQIAAGNQDLSQRTEQQAASLQETASSMEQLTGTVKQNAENAQQANQLAQQASDVALKGGKVVGEVVETMVAINQSSSKISEIIAVIDGIAFQTNILALNAAVEAARAGDQGRGFAVVAAEVRTLAQRSATAAKEIKALIDDSVGKVETGTRLVARAGETMDEIVGSIRRVSDIVAEITAASREQTGGIEQVSRAISQMDQVTQQNAALVEQAAAAAQSMTEQAQALVQKVSVFKVSAEAQAPLQPARAIATPPPARAVRQTVDKLPSPGTLPPGRPAPQRAIANASDWQEF